MYQDYLQVSERALRSITPNMQYETVQNIETINNDSFLWDMYPLHLSRSEIYYLNKNVEHIQSTINKMNFSYENQNYDHAGYGQDSHLFNQNQNAKEDVFDRIRRKRMRLYNLIPYLDKLYDKVVGEYANNYQVAKYTEMNRNGVAL